MSDSKKSGDERVRLQRWQIGATAPAISTDVVTQVLAPDAVVPEVIAETATEDPVFGKYSSWNKNHIWWLVALLSVGVLMVGANASADSAWRQIGPEVVPFASTHNAKQSGYSGLYELCKKVGLNVQQWEQPYRYLKEKNVTGTLVIIDPFEVPQAEDAERINNWVAAGNNLVYFDYFGFGPGRRLLDKLGGEAHGPAAEVAEETITPKVSSRNWKFVDSLLVRSDTTVSGGTSLGDGKRGSVIMKLNHQKGSGLICTDPSVCSNQHIADPQYKGNFQFVVNHLAQCKQPIYFDEKSHGFSSGSSAFFFMLRRYSGWVIAQLILIALIALVSASQRFGQARHISSGRRISNLEFIDGLAATYRRAHARDAAWAMLFLPMKARLCKTLGVAPHENMDVLARAWAEASGKDAKEYETFLQQGLDATRQRKLSERDLLGLIGESERLSSTSRELVLAQRVLGA